MNLLQKLLQHLRAPDPVPTDERRQSVRLNFRFDITVRSTGREVPATVVNLTFTGLCLRTESKLEEGDEVSLHRDDFGPAFKGTVMWDKRQPSGQYLVGIECELDEEKLIGSWLEPALVQAGFEAEYAAEKRQLVRVPGRVRCKLRSTGGEDFGEQSMLDLSLGGALLESSRELPKGTVVQYETVPLGSLPPLRGDATVVSSRLNEHGTWLCGIQFGDQEEDELRPYMESMLTSKAR